MKIRNDTWRQLSKALKISGFVFCVVVFLSLNAQVVYYSAHRLVVPQAQSAQTVGLSWTHPVHYGTVRDERRSQWLFNSFFLGFGLIAAAEMIKIYKLGGHSGLRKRLNNPWNHKWGP